MSFKVNPDNEKICVPRPISKIQNKPEVGEFEYGDDDDDNDEDDDVDEDDKLEVDDIFQEDVVC